jgi:hypothetical protein
MVVSWLGMGVDYYKNLKCSRAYGWVDKRSPSINFLANYFLTNKCIGMFHGFDACSTCNIYVFVQYGTVGFVNRI